MNKDAETQVFVALLQMKERCAYARVMQSQADSEQNDVMCRAWSNYAVETMELIEQLEKRLTWV